MNWLVLIALAVLFDSLRIFTDNYYSDVFFKGRYVVSSKLFFGCVHIIIFGILLAATGFNPLTVDSMTILFIAISGIFASLAGIPYYRALELDDSTNIGIFTQLAPVLYLIIGWFFLGDRFSPMQLVAFVIILFAPLLIVLTTKRRSRKIRIHTVLYASLYVLLAVIGNVFFVEADNGSVGFVHEVSLMYSFNGITDIILILSVRKWRHRLFTVIKKSHKKVYIPMTASICVGILKQFAYRSALIAAPALALASVAADSTEPIVIFFLGLLLTLIWPKFGREKLDRKTICIHFVATTLVVTGIIILQFQ